jgi:hypothetical protein
LIYTAMNTKIQTWTHSCSSASGTFVVLGLDEICPRCLINCELHALRHDGFLVTPPSRSKTLVEKGKVKLAALFSPKQKVKKSIDQDEQTQHLHRIG